MKMGTKSVLYGAHCFFIHPWFAALGWWNLYGFPWDPRLWVMFFVHDLGYWGKQHMDDEEGERHPEWGARVMSKLFDKHSAPYPGETPDSMVAGSLYLEDPFIILMKWGRMSLYHSRFLAKQHGAQPSKFCAADKLAICLEPWWLYLPRVILSGEIREYMALAGVRNPNSKYAGEPPTKYESMGLDLSSRRAWFENMTEYLRTWVEEHKDGREDTWTPDSREARDDTGVWQ